MAISRDKKGRIKATNKAKMAKQPISVLFQIEVDKVLRSDVVSDRSAYIRQAVLEKMQRDGLMK